MRKPRIAELLIVGVIALSSSVLAQYPQVYQPKPGTVPSSSQAGTNVTRKPAGTPEVVSMTPKEVDVGGKREVVFELKNLEPSQVTAVEGWGSCQKIVGFAPASATAIKITIDIPAASASSCDIQLKARTGRALYGHIKLSSPEERKRRADAEKQVAQATAQSQQFYNQMKAAQSAVGKQWTVQFANGQKDSWTVFHTPDDQGVPIHFKNAAGQEMQISHANGVVNIVTKQGCLMMGQLRGNKAEGQVLYGCSQPQGSRWSATIQQ